MCVAVELHNPWGMIDELLVQCVTAKKTEAPETERERTTYTRGCAATPEETAAEAPITLEAMRLPAIR